MFTEKTSLIIPTKDRAKKVINLLNQISEKNIFVILQYELIYEHLL